MSTKTKLLFKNFGSNKSQCLKIGFWLSDYKSNLLYISTYFLSLKDSQTKDTMYSTYNWIEQVNVK